MSKDERNIVPHEKILPSGKRSIKAFVLMLFRVKYPPCTYAQYSGGYHKYRGGYLEYRGGCSVLSEIHDKCGDILSTVGVFMSTWGDFLSTVGDTQYHGRYHDANKGIS